MSARMEAGRVVRSNVPGRAGSADNIGAEILSAGTSFVKRRPAFSSLWVLGLLAGAAFNGFSVSQHQLDTYVESMEHASHVTDREVNQARRLFKEADARYFHLILERSFKPPD